MMLKTFWIIQQIYKKRERETLSLIVRLIFIDENHGLAGKTAMHVRRIMMVFVSELPLPSLDKGDRDQMSTSDNPMGNICVSLWHHQRHRTNRDDRIGKGTFLFSFETKICSVFSFCPNSSLDWRLWCIFILNCIVFLHTDWRWIDFRLISPEMIELLVKHHWIEGRNISMARRKRISCSSHMSNEERKIVTHWHTQCPPIRSTDWQFDTKDRHCHCRWLFLMLIGSIDLGKRSASEKMSDLNQRRVPSGKAVKPCVTMHSLHKEYFFTFHCFSSSSSSSSSLWLIAITYVFCWPFA